MSHFTLFVLCFASLVVRGVGTNFTWVGGGVGNWFNSSAWSPQGVPGPVDNVVIEGPGVNVSVAGGADVFINSLAMTEAMAVFGVRLNVSDVLSLYGSVLLSNNNNFTTTYTNLTESRIILQNTTFTTTYANLTLLSTISVTSANVSFLSTVWGDYESTIIMDGSGSEGPYTMTVTGNFTIDYLITTQILLNNPNLGTCGFAPANNGTVMAVNTAWYLQKGLTIISKTKPCWYVKTLAGAFDNSSQLIANHCPTWEASDHLMYIAAIENVNIIFSPSACYVLIETQLLRSTVQAPYDMPILDGVSLTGFSVTVNGGWQFSRARFFNVDILTFAANVPGSDTALIDFSSCTVTFLGAFTASNFSLTGTTANATELTTTSLFMNDGILVVSSLQVVCVSYATDSSLTCGSAETQCKAITLGDVFWNYGTITINGTNVVLNLYSEVNLDVLDTLTTHVDVVVGLYNATCDLVAREKRAAWRREVGARRPGWRGVKVKGSDYPYLNAYSFVNGPASVGYKQVGGCPPGDGVGLIAVSTLLGVQMANPCQTSVVELQGVSIFDGSSSPITLTNFWLEPYDNMTVQGVVNLNNVTVNDDSFGAPSFTFFQSPVESTLTLTDVVALVDESINCAATSNGCSIVSAGQGSRPCGEGWTIPANQPFSGSFSLTCT